MQKVGKEKTWWFIACVQVCLLWYMVIVQICQNWELCSTKTRVLFPVLLDQQHHSCPLHRGPGGDSSTGPQFWRCKATQRMRCFARYCSLQKKLFLLLYWSLNNTGKPWECSETSAEQDTWSLKEGLTFEGQSCCWPLCISWTDVRGR